MKVFTEIDTILVKLIKTSWMSIRKYKALDIAIKSWLKFPDKPWVEIYLLYEEVELRSA
jgi:hypothetical protein